MFEVKGLKVKKAVINDTEAKKYFDESVTYLKKSDFAKFIIEELAGVRAKITVWVGDEITSLVSHFSKVSIGQKLVNRYYHPKIDTSVDGGIILWNPLLTVQAIDKAKRRKKLDWIPKHYKTTLTTSSYLIPKLKEVDIDHTATISQHVCLIHEMGHVYQYFSDPNEFRKLTTSRAALHEEYNVQIVENTVALELIAAGCKEGLRWWYDDTV